MSKKLIYLACFVLVLGLALTSAANAADPSLVGWWKLDGNAEDSSGNDNHGTLVGNPQWVAGKIGGALEFDSADGDDYVDCGNPSVLDFAGSWTVCAWIKMTPGQGGTIFAKGGDNSGGIRYEFSGSTTIGLIVDDNDNKESAGGSTIVNDDQWHHVVAMRDGTELRLYVDGVKDGTGTVPAGYNLSGTSQRNAYIGAIINNETSQTKDYFNGLIDDVLIFSRALTRDEIQQVMIGLQGKEAFNPSPADNATDVPRGVVLSWRPGESAPATNGHKVFFSENFNDVNDGIGGVTQSASSYAPPQRLDFDTTYYWRVDEVNNVHPDSPWTGGVWSFTTEPIGYPIDNITATASSSAAVDQGPENAVNGSGLDESGLLHSKDIESMWLSDPTELQPAWIKFEFDKVYKLHEMWVWNSNSIFELSLAAIGFKDVSIEYSVDGTDYTTLGTTHEFTRALGADDYAHDTTVDLNGVAAKYVRLTANSNWGGFMPQYSLSEVRFLYIPVHAREPYPDSRATDVDLDVVLGFRAGREAAEHNVYLSSDEQAVIDGNALVNTVTEASYDPLSLDLGETYYWRIDEVNETKTPTTWQGDIWSFSTQEYLVVDDFEDYNDYPPDEIFSTWIDGWGDSANGALVAHDVAPWAETTIVHGGEQAMPFFYSNTGGATYSEATRTFAVPQNWTEAGVQTLALYLHGTSGNTGQLYVKINDTKVPYDGDATDITRPRWKQWNIDLASLGADLQSVTKLSIGIDGNGASGTLYIDDIRLYRLAPEIVVSSEEIWIEAEAAVTITEPLYIFYDDPAASGGSYIGAAGNSKDAPPYPDGTASYTFTVGGGTYKVSGRVIMPDGDSWWARIPGATIPAETVLHSSGWAKWEPPDSDNWFWNDVFSGDDDENATVHFTLAAGTHTLEIAYREDGALLDVIVISKID